MGSSSPLAAPATRTRALLVGVVLLAGGCAHASAAASAARPAAAAPARPASAPANAAPAAPSGYRDPSEEITPEELASIPDPVPAGNGSAPPAAVPAKAPVAAPEARSAAPESIAPASPPIAAPTAPPVAAPPGEFTWRVQILATPDRALAARVAAEAAERLGTSATIDVESGLSKVRLGGFATEGEAQVLKGRAVEMGYPGAFRVKVRTRASDE